MHTLRILIADDVASLRRLLSRALEVHADFEVVGTVPIGPLALEKAARLLPDLIILGLPDGESQLIETLKALRLALPTRPVLIASPAARCGAPLTLDALAHGASAYVTLPEAPGEADAATLDAIRRAILPKIEALTPTRRGGGASQAPGARDQRLAAGGKDVCEVLTIGASTGGPNVLTALVGKFPADFPIPILIVQHMPASFTRSLAERLDAACAIEVREAVAGEVPRPGTVRVAPGDRHLALERDGDVVRIALNQGPPENSCRPSVDVLFRSASTAYDGHVLAVVLTGMGCDGLRGCREIRAQGGAVLVQDEATSVVWGMPGAAYEVGAVESLHPLTAIAAKIMSLANERNSARHNAA